MSAQAIAATAEGTESGGISAGLFRSTLLVVAIQVLGTALRYASQVLFARWIGRNDYGNYCYAMTLAQILAIVGSLGLPTGVIRFVPEYVAQSDWSRLRGLVRRGRQLVGAAAIACAVLASGALMIARPSKLNMPVLLGGVWLTPIMALSGFESDLSRSLYSLGLSYSLPMIMDPFVSIALALVLMRTAGYLTAALVIAARYGSLAITLAMQTAGSQAALPKQARNPEPVSDTALWLSVSFPLLLAGLYTAIMSKADVLVLGLYRTTEEVGIYSAAAATAALGSLVLSAANARGAPLMSTMFASGDRRGLERVVHTVTFWCLWPAVAVALTMWAGGERILALFGPGFSTGYRALAILAAGHVINCGAGPVAMLAIVTGHQAATARALGWSALGNIALCLILVPPFGLLGAALASAATLAMVNLRLYRVATRNLGIRPLDGLRSAIFGTRRLSRREI